MRFFSVIKNSWIHASLVTFHLKSSSGQTIVNIIGDSCKDLVSGAEETKIGSACATATEASLDIVISVTESGCVLDNTHICNLPYVSDNGLLTSDHTMSIPMDEAYEFVCGYDDTNYDIAGHAFIRCEDNSGENAVRSFHPAYYEIPLQCTEVIPAGNSGAITPPDGSCKTAFAFMANNNACYPHRLGNKWGGQSCATCFQHISSPDDYASFHRWGWINGPFEPVGANPFYTSESGSYEMEIHAGATECNVRKESAELVGTMSVAFDQQGKVAASFDVFADFEIAETHLYVGTEMLPRDENNDFDVTPGLYPYIHEGLAGGTTSDNYDIIETFSGPIFITAHAIVCRQGAISTTTGGPSSATTPEAGSGSVTMTTSAPVSTTVPSTATNATGTAAPPNATSITAAPATTSLVSVSTTNERITTSSPLTTINTTEAEKRSVTITTMPSEGESSAPRTTTILTTTTTSTTTSTTTTTEGPIYSIDLIFTVDGQDANDINSRPEFNSGDILSLEYTVTNDGNRDVENPVVTVPGIKDFTCDSDAPQLLVAGASFTCTTTITADTPNFGAIANATANPTDPTFSQIHDEDPVYFHVPGPFIDIEVTVDGQDADSAADAPFFDKGVPVPVTYEVTNIGTEELLNINVDVPGIPPELFADCTVPEPLAVGASFTCSAEFISEEPWFESTATVTADPSVSATGQIYDNDDVNFHIAGPFVDIELYVNDEDADTLASAPTYSENESVTLKFKITNTGDEDLNRIMVKMDNLETGLEFPCTTDGASRPIKLRLGTKLSSRLILRPEESITCLSDTNNVPFSAIGTVNAAAAVSYSGTVSDEDPVHYLVDKPSTSFKLFVNDEDANDADDRPEYLIGDPIELAYVIVNNGNTKLVDPIVDITLDKNPGPFICSKYNSEGGSVGTTFSMILDETVITPPGMNSPLDLEVGESIKCHVSFTAKREGDQDNYGSLTMANPATPDGNRLEAEDPAFYFAWWEGR